MGKPITNIFDWLEEITLTKSPSSSFSEEEWGKWNTHTINRFISMNINYIDIVNYVQKINLQHKEQIYSIYREMIPKNKTWFKYIKSQTTNKYKELSKHVSKYFGCSIKEAEEYIKILHKEGTLDVLYNMGIVEKEAKKLVKEIKS